MLNLRKPSPKEPTYEVDCIDLCTHHYISVDLRCVNVGVTKQLTCSEDVSTSRNGKSCECVSACMECNEF